MTSRDLFMAGSAILCCVTVAVPATAQTRTVNIDPQPVRSAIGALSRQWDIQILAARKVTRDKVANPVHGNMSASDALTRLLHGTGLFAKQTGPQTYTILPVAAAAPARQTAAAFVPVALHVPAPMPQVEPAPPPAAEEEQQDIVVTGFRAALDEALELKRRETGTVDSIIAEDIGKFPDANLAESMQRIPGVALGRGDGGEGRGISVRGLGSRFTRVRINGMEGMSQTSGSDIYGQFNSGRSFDFNTFPTEIFSALSVRKTPSAETEEGSLGATVDLRAPKPFDQKGDFVVTGTARGIYNELSKQADPRLSALVSKKFGDSFGILASAAYTKRNLQEYGYQSGNVLPAYVSGLAQTVPVPGVTPPPSIVFPYCTPIGYIYNGVAVNSPGIGYANNNTPVGASETHCSTNNPRTSTVEAFDKIMALTGPSGRPGGGAFIPRVPRPVWSQQDQERIAGTVTLQWQPTDRTDISIDGLYARFKVRRIDAFLSPQSMARTAGNNGQPMMSVRDIEFDQLGTMTYGLWDGVDLRSDVQDEQFTSTFRQVNLNFDHRISDNLRIYGLAGISDSKLKVDKVTMGIDAIDTDNFSVDFRDGGDIPVINYGIDVSNPDNFAYQAPLADGTQLGTLLGFRRHNTVDNKTFELNAEWKLNDNFTVVVGGQHRTSNFKAETWNVAPPNSVPAALPAGTSVRDISFQVIGNDSVMPGYPASWVGLDPDKWKAAVGYNSFALCGIECGSYFATVDETYNSGFVMVKFNTEGVLPFTLRGDAGVRYVRTGLDTTGVVPVQAPPGSPYPSAGAIGRVERSYEDWLPSMNLVLEVTPDILLRASAARVMTRPNYLSMVPAGNVSGNTREGNFGNPYLDPARADTFDVAAEWYFAPGSLLSVAYFHKNLESYVQTLSTFVPFNTLGLPESVLANTTAKPDDYFTITRSENTPGGTLSGVEVNLQLPFRFLPGFLSNFGLLANYTHVGSRIDYVLQSANGVPTLTVNERLVDLSPDTVSATLYYEDERFSIRSTANYRSAYLTQVPSGGNDSDVRGILGATYVDASASYKINDNIKLIAEVQNITNERNRLYIDSKRLDPLHTTFFGRTYAVAVNVAF